MEEKIIPPDGGWGWMVVLAFAFNNLIMVPVVSGMGIIFKDIFPVFAITPTEATIIMSTNMSFGMLMGLIHGPLLRTFGYRKIAISGTVMFSAGLMLTAFATKFSHYLLSHGILTSFGIGLGMAAFSLAVNTYFVEKRGRAMGVAMTLTGLGPILMPQLISVMLNAYTAQGAIILLGGIALNTVCAALLLQPVKWHAKCLVNEPQDVDEEIKTAHNDIVKNSETTELKIDETQNEFTVSKLKLHSNNEDLPLLEIVDEKCETQIIFTKRDSVTLRTNGNGTIAYSQSVCDVSDKTTSENGIENKSYKWWNSGKSLESVNLGSCFMIYDELTVYSNTNDLPTNENDKKSVVSKEKNFSQNYKNTGSNEKTCNLVEQEVKNEQFNNSEILRSSKNYLTHLFDRIVNFFDLTLFCDPIYVNMMLGISIATCAETNFAILTPFILDEMNFTNSQIAAVMSTMAAIDLLMRGLSPYVGERLRQTPRKMYLVSLIMLIVSRSMLLFYTNFIAVTIMAVGIGFAKGFRAVYMTLVVPSYVPIERLPHAQGIQIFFNGLVLLILGSIMGVLRESKGSFMPCITLINFMTALTVIMWLIEMSFTKSKI